MLPGDTYVACYLTISVSIFIAFFRFYQAEASDNSKTQKLFKFEPVQKSQILTPKTSAFSSQPGSSQCVPQCKTISNRIMVTGGTSKAGISDRHSLLKHFSNLASHLCARLYMKPPCAILAVQHNNDKTVNCGLEWSDFFEIPIAEDGQPRLVSQSGIPKMVGMGDFNFRISDKKQRSIISQFGLASLIAEEQKAETENSSSSSFEWVIEQPYYKWRSVISGLLTAKYLKTGSEIPKIMNTQKFGCEYSRF